MAAGAGAAVGFGVGIGSGGVDVFGFAGAKVGSGGSVETGGRYALVGVGASVRGGVGVPVGAAVGDGVAVGADVLGGGVFGLGGPPRATVVDDPAGTETSTPPALVSTDPEIVTTVVSPLGETETYESDPARITDAMPAV